MAGGKQAGGGFDMRGMIAALVKKGIGDLDKKIEPVVERVVERILRAALGAGKEAPEAGGRRRRRKRSFSAATRAKMAASQKARWDKARAAAARKAAKAAK
ncbi:MAG: hypothetical protein A2V83_08195 [Nitrospirae bacterium RBG_16_64_22]|nr:MAG: hypothetical protein A2V83_08195 [Nitrospirae bacterium RBG_16_64_22]